MNRISRHISYLLLTCRTVTIPGLCSLSANYEPANFDLDNGVFYPSRLRIAVSNRDLDNRKLLSNSLQRKLNLDSREVEKLLNEFVVNVKSRLMRQHYCRLDGIGYLFRDHNGTLIIKDTFWKSLPSSTQVVPFSLL